MSERTTVRLFHLPFSFTLPPRVASERGYFGDEGLRVELIERDRETVAAMERLFDRLLDVAGADALGVAEIPDGTFRPEAGR